VQMTVGSHKGVSCEVDPFYSSGVRSVGASARRFPLTAADGDARFMTVVAGYGSKCHYN